MQQSLALAILSLNGLFSVARDLALIGVQEITPSLIGMLGISGSRVHAINTMGKYGLVNRQQGTIRKCPSTE
jgi:hypothetical protein